MHPLNLLTPWIVFAAILFPLLWLERWIHRHLYGVGWLLSKGDKQIATLLYYLILAPGVFVHEFSQWLIAYALGVSVKKVRMWPETQSDGTLRLNFIKMEKTDPIRAAILGAVPLVLGVLIVLFISYNILDVEQLSTAFSTGQLPVVFAQFQQFFAAPDFWLWLYLLFAIGNAMIPTPDDRQGWPLIFGIFGVTTFFLLIMGLGEEVLLPLLQGPLARALSVLAAAFTTILALDFFVLLGLGLVENVLQKVQKQQFPYQTRAKPSASKVLPGGEAPLPPELTPLRIAERRLPVPPAPKRQTTKKAAASALSTPSPLAKPIEAAPARPVIGPSVREVKTLDDLPYRPAEALNPSIIRRRIGPADEPYEEAEEIIDEVDEELVEDVEDVEEIEAEISPEDKDLDGEYDETSDKEVYDEYEDDEDYRDGEDDDEDDGELRYVPLDDLP